MMEDDDIDPNDTSIVDSSVEEVDRGALEKYSIDWKYWAKMPGWTVEEAAAIWEGFDPDKINYVKQDADEAIKSRLFEYQRKLRMLTRANHTGELESIIDPRDFVKWCVSNDLKLRREVRRSVGPKVMITNWRRQNAALTKVNSRLRRIIKDLRSNKPVQEPRFDDIAPKSRTALFKILLSIAEQKYSYRPVGRNSAAKQIAGAIEDSLFDGPEEETVRKWLQTASAELQDKRQAINDTAV